MISISKFLLYSCYFILLKFFFIIEDGKLKKCGSNSLPYKRRLCRRRRKVGKETSRLEAQEQQACCKWKLLGSHPNPCSFTRFQGYMAALLFSLLRVNKSLKQSFFHSRKSTVFLHNKCRFHTMQESTGCSCIRQSSHFMLFSESTGLDLNAQRKLRGRQPAGVAVDGDLM